MSGLKEIEYKNELNQTIKPGDKVFYLGSSWNNITINTGEFVGVYMGKRWWNSEEERVIAVKVKNVPVIRVHYKMDSEGKYIKDDSGFIVKDRTEVVGHRTARLPLCRVYKIDTPMSEFYGQSL